MKVQIRVTHAQRWLGADTYFVPTVELWVGGRRFDHECDTIEEAMKLALDVAHDLGISVDE